MPWILPLCLLKELEKIEVLSVSPQVALWRSWLTLQRVLKELPPFHHTFSNMTALNGFLPPVDWVLWLGLSSPLLNRSTKEHQSPLLDKRRIPHYKTKV